MLRRKPLSRKAPLARGRSSRTRPRHSLPHTVQEDRHLSAVAGLGCYCCHLDGLGWHPARVHHSRTRPDGSPYGTGKRASHFETFPLCDRHHANYGKQGEALHAGHRSWVARYGSELQALAWVAARLGVPCPWEDAS